MWTTAWYLGAKHRPPSCSAPHRQLRPPLDLLLLDPFPFSQVSADFNLVSSLLIPLWFYSARPVLSLGRSEK